MKKKRPEQPKLDMDLGQARFPPTSLGEGKKGMRTEDLEIIRERELAQEEKQQQDMFADRKKISLSTTHCLNRDGGKGKG